MSEKLHQLFKNIAQMEPSEKLERRILRRIEIERNRQIKTKLDLIYAGIALSLGAFLCSVVSQGSVFLKSEFFHLVTLMFSDAKTVMSYWNDFLFSLLETFPVADMIFVLVPAFATLVLLAMYFNLNNNRHKYI